MKIFLADLAHTSTVPDEAQAVPLNIGYLKAYAVAHHGDSVDIELFKKPDVFIERSVQEQPDVIGLSHYSWNENLCKAVGKYLRKKLPCTLFVSGGPNVDPDTRGAAGFFRNNDFVDFLVSGGGEEPFSELIQWYKETPEAYDKLPKNLMWLDGCDVKTTGERGLQKKIEGIPSPYLSGYLDEFLAMNMIPLFETNRGCPFKCTFCTWGAASKNLVRQFDVDQVFSEFEYVSERSKARTWINCDANFGILKRDVEIAKLIRKLKDKNGYPELFATWLSKNTTERNVEIGQILFEMNQPVMALQTTDEEVLKNVKRGNISSEAYIKYQQLFHENGQRTYSNLIVPLPGETLESHVNGLRDSIAYGVDYSLNHNLRLLAGSEINSEETRKKYFLKTRFRLIPGEASEYETPDGTLIRAFEYEESPRVTPTMSEEDLFYIRLLHFLTDGFWNNEIYKPLLKAVGKFGVNAIDVLTAVLDIGLNQRESDDVSVNRVRQFFDEVDTLSRDEWFDTKEEMEAHFYKDENFATLLKEVPEKLYMHATVILLKSYKRDFDHVMRLALDRFDDIPKDVKDGLVSYSAEVFPSLDDVLDKKTIELPQNIMALLGSEFSEPKLELDDLVTVEYMANKARIEARDTILNTPGSTLSKELASRGIQLWALQYDVKVS